MSYIRSGSPLTFVEGESKDYIYCDGKNIIDYGGIDSTSIVDILATRFLSEDKEFRDYIIPILAERLGVKLRDKPLSHEEWSAEHDRLVDKAIKESKYDSS